MAFGKDPNHVDTIPAYGGSFSQRAKTAARTAPHKGGGGGFYWKDCYAPPVHTPDIIRLIPGAYDIQLSHDGENVTTERLPYVPYREHHNRKRGCICSAGPLFANRKLAAPCPSCTVFWEDVRTRKEKKNRGDTTKGPDRMSCRDLFAFNVWDYGLYFKMPDKDANGQLRMNSKTNQPYYTWTKGEVNNPEFNGLESKYGHLSAFPMGTTYKETLLEWDTKIGQSCKGCGALGSIATVMKICGNSQCGQYVYDPNNCTLTVEQKKQIDFYPYTCQHCRQTNYVNEIIQCGNPNCQKAVRATIFDVDLQVQRLGAAGSITFLQVFTHSEPRPIQVFDAAVLETIKPLDLLQKFAPTPPEAQVKFMGVSMVAAAPQQQQPTMPQHAMPTMTMGGMPQAMPQGAQPVAPQPPGFIQQPTQMPAVAYQQPQPPGFTPQQ